MGLKDYYVASVKAALLSQAPTATIVDISHNVRSFDIPEAAFQLRSIWKQFPIGTVHIIGINSEYSKKQTHLVVQYMSHYFIAADNGIFSLLFDDIPEDIYEINIELGFDWTFPMKGVFATVAAHLSKGGTAEFIGKRVQSYKEVLGHTPIVDADNITTHVEYIDKYGNIYLNITKSIFEETKKGRSFAIQIKKSHNSMRKISNNFSDVPDGDRLAMWASNGHLMIALNGGATDHGGGATDLLGMKKGDIVNIIFYDYQNSEDEF